MEKLKFEILVSRVYDFQKVEIKAISDEPLSFEEANEFRRKLAKLADEARRELKLAVDTEKEIDRLTKRSLELEYAVADYPKTDEGKFDAPNMTKDQVRLAKEYKYVLEQLATTSRYGYTDDINKIDFND